MKTPFLIGRILLGGFFLQNGINHLLHANDMKGYVEAKGVPAPKAAVTLSAIPLIIGGTSLLLGVKPKVGTLAILGFLAGVSPIMHDFWKNEDPQEKEKNKIDFMKNAALAGAALALMGVDEPWEASVPIAQPSLMNRAMKKVRKLAA